jgi:hypothetical protein
MLIKRLATVGLHGRAGAAAAREHRHGRLQPCVVKGMAAQQARIERQLLHAQTAEPALHDDLTGQQPPHGLGAAVQGGHSIAQRQHAAALGPDRLALRHMLGNAVAQLPVLMQGPGMQLRIAAGQPDRIAGRQRIASQRREKAQLCPHGTQTVQIGGIKENAASRAMAMRRPLSQGSTRG